MNVLVIAPHRDDEVLGVGGTILKRKAAGDSITVCIVTAREGEELPPETLTTRIRRELRAAHSLMGVDRYIGFPFAPNILETYSRKELNKAFLDAIVAAQPEEVFLPFWGDMQKDHQLVTEAAMVALRAKYEHPVKRIYAYETLSETGIGYPTAEKAFIPNVYVDISDFLEKKLDAMRCYESQVGAFPDLRSTEAIESLARFRGATVNAAAAEAFMLIREIQ